MKVEQPFSFPGLFPAVVLRLLRSFASSASRCPYSGECYIPAMNDLAGRHIVLGLTGGIACYKAAELCARADQGGRDGAGRDDRGGRALHHGGDDAGAVEPAGLSPASGMRASPTTWPHINLTREADAILVAPASADFIAKLAQGRADELLSLMCLARPIDTLPAAAGAGDEPRDVGPPGHPAQRGAGARRRRHVLGPGAGDQACGEVGDGRMLEAAELLRRPDRVLPAQGAGRQARADHRRAHLRGDRPGARHHQPVQRQDGLCDRARRAARPAPRSRWWPARSPAHAARRDAHRRARARSRCTTP